VDAVTAVSTATDLTLILPDRIGSLAETLRKLADADVNIVGHAGFPAWAGEGILHVVVDDVSVALQALAANGIELREQREVLVVDVEHVPGSLASIFERIASVGANVDLTYSLADQRVVIGANFVERAIAALSRE
jgi:hypothetical protein